MKKNIFRVSLIFTIIALIGRIFGLIRDMILARQLGANNITDAYNVALSIPNMVFSICAAAILITFIPNFLEIKKKYGLDEAYKFTNKFTTVLLAIAFVFYVISMIFTGTLVKILAPSFNPQTKYVAINLTRIMLVNLFFMVISSVISSILRTEEKYITTSIMPMMTSVILIVFLVISKSTNIYLITFITSIGFCLQFVVLLPELKECKFKYKIVIDGYNDRIKNILKSILPIMFGFAISQISLLIDKNIASSFHQGTITSLELANKVSSMIYGILSGTILTIFFPIMSQKYVNNEIEDWLNIVVKVIVFATMFLIPTVIGVILFKNEIIIILFKRGKFDDLATATTVFALSGIIVQLPFLAIRDIVGQAFYSIKDVLSPVINGTLAVILNIILTILLSKFYGVFGITFATSISIFISSIYMLYQLKRKYINLDIRYIVIAFIKILTASMIMGIIVFISKMQLENFIYNSFLTMLICGLIGVVIEYMLLSLLKVKEIQMLNSLIKRL